MVPGPLHVITSDPGDDAFRIPANALVAFTISSKIRIAHRRIEDCRTFIRLGINSFLNSRIGRHPVASSRVIGLVLSFRRSWGGARLWMVSVSKP